MPVSPARNPHPGRGTAVEYYVCLQERDRYLSYERVIADGQPDEPEVRPGEDDTISIISRPGPRGGRRAPSEPIATDVNAAAGVIELKVGYDERVLISFPIYHVAGEDNIVRHTFMPNTLYISGREGSIRRTCCVTFRGTGSRAARWSPR